MTSTDVSTPKLFFNITMAANVSPLCKVAGSSALIDRGTDVVNLVGEARPRPRVGCMAKAPTVNSDGIVGVHRSFVPFLSLLKKNINK